MLGNEWIGGDPVFAQRPRCACFVLTHQSQVTHHISGKDRGETTDRGHGSPGDKVPLTEFTPKPAAALVPGQCIPPVSRGSLC